MENPWGGVLSASPLHERQPSGGAFEPLRQPCPSPSSPVVLTKKEPRPKTQNPCSVVPPLGRTSRTKVLRVRPSTGITGASFFALAPSPFRLVARVGLRGRQEGRRPRVGKRGWGDRGPGGAGEGLWTRGGGGGEEEGEGGSRRRRRLPGKTCIAYLLCVFPPEFTRARPRPRRARPLADARAHAHAAAETSARGSRPRATRRLAAPTPTTRHSEAWER